VNIGASYLGVLYLPLGSAKNWSDDTVQKTLAARGLEEHVRVSLIFVIIISFVLFTEFTLVYVLYFEEYLIHDSRGFMISKNN